MTTEAEAIHSALKSYNAIIDRNGGYQPWWESLNEFRHVLRRDGLLAYCPVTTQLTGSADELLAVATESGGFVLETCRDLLYVPQASLSRERDRFDEMVRTMVRLTNRFTAELEQCGTDDFWQTVGETAKTTHPTPSVPDALQDFHAAFVTVWAGATECIRDLGGVPRFFDDLEEPWNVEELLEPHPQLPIYTRSLADKMLSDLNRIPKMDAAPSRPRPALDRPHAATGAVGTGTSRNRVRPAGRTGRPGAGNTARTAASARRDAGKGGGTDSAARPTGGRRKTARVYRDGPTGAVAVFKGVLRSLKREAQLLSPEEEEHAAAVDEIHAYLTAAVLLTQSATDDTPLAEYVGWIRSRCHTWFDTDAYVDGLRNAYNDTTASFTPLEKEVRTIKALLRTTPPGEESDAGNFLHSIDTLNRRLQRANEVMAAGIVEALRIDGLPLSAVRSGHVEPRPQLVLGLAERYKTVLDSYATLARRIDRLTGHTSAPRLRERCTASPELTVDFSEYRGPVIQPLVAYVMKVPNVPTARW